MTTSVAQFEATILLGLLVWKIGTPVWLAGGLAVLGWVVLAAVLTRLMPVVPLRSDSVPAAPRT